MLLISRAKKINQFLSYQDSFTYENFPGLLSIYLIHNFGTEFLSLFFNKLTVCLDIQYISTESTLIRFKII